MKLQIKRFSELSNRQLYKIIEARIDVFVVEQNCPYKECDN
ncbi:MAG: GNAT family N-acetyltransferase, partial [Halanaerobium sp.]